MAYPSTVTTLTNPLPTDHLNSPSHSSIETSQNTEITALENYVGTINSIVGSLSYDIRGVGSNGGGHVQSANKGGTGQTNFVKGDLLVATSSSVLSKLAISSVAGYVLQTDTSQSTGIAWGVGTSKVFTTASSITTATTARTSLFTAAIPGGTLSTSNAIQGRVYIGVVNGINAVNNLTLELEYGGNNLTGVVTAIRANNSNVKEGYMDFLVVANGAVNSQKMNFTYLANFGNDFTTTDPVYTYGKTISSVASGSDANLVAFATMSSGDGTSTYLRMHSAVVEKI